MDLKLFLLVGLCCVLRSSAQDMRDKAMEAARSGQLRRLHSRFGRNFVMPPAPADLADEDEAKQMNEILNTISGEEGEMEPDMADNKWHLPLEKQLLKYLWSRKSRSA